MITDKQLAFARRLLSERLATLGFATVEEAAQAMQLSTRSKDDARIIIDRLLKMPADPDTEMPEVVAMADRKGKGNRPGTCFTCRQVVTENEGYYFMGGDGRWHVHHKLNQCPTPETAVQGIDLSHVPAGCYGFLDTRFKVRIDKPTTGKWKGWTFVSDAAVYGWQGKLGRAEPEGLYVGKAMEQIAAIAADPKTHMANYGHLTSKCGKCGRPLEDEESIARGIGPVCATKGW